MKRIITTIALLILVFQSYGQQESARELLAQSLKAYGGWDNVETLEYKVNGSRNAGAQAKKFNNGEKQEYNAIRTYNFPEKQLFEINKNFFPGGYVFNFATIVNDTIAFQYDVNGSRTGKVYQTGGKASVEGRFSAINNHIAYYKVKELFNSTDSLSLLDNAEEKIGIRRINNGNNGVVDYYFSKQDYLLQKVVSGPQEIVFSQYRNNDGRRENLSVAFYSEDKLFQEDNISDIKTAFPFNPALLKLPTDYVKATSEPVSKPNEIAKDIFLIENLAGDRNVLFVNMDEYIVVIEAPISSELSKQVISLIKETLPEKPIKYVFTTHYHNDHTGGLRQYVHEGAELIMANHTKEYVKELVAGDGKDDLGNQPKDASYLVIEDSLILKDQNHLIEFYEVPNSHSDGMALTYFPNEKIIYQGDLLSIPKDGTRTKPIEVTREMITFLKNKNWEFIRMIGHHGHNFITMEMLNSSIQD